MMARSLIFVMAAVVVVAGGGCSSSNGSGADAATAAGDGGADGRLADGGAPLTTLALLGGALADSPWPSDVFLVDGRVRVKAFPFAGHKATHAQVIAALAQLDGAPVKTSIFFRTDRGDALADGPQAGKSATLYDLTAPTAPAVTLPLFFRQATRHLVALAPRDFAMTPGHRYACVVADRELVAPSPEMAAALRGEGPQAAVYKPLRDQAKALGVDLATVGAATVFKVGEPQAALISLVAQVDKLAAPEARLEKLISGAASLDAFFGVPDTKRSGLGDPKGIVHDAVGAVVLGQFDSPRFLSGKKGQLGTIATDNAGLAKQNGTMTVPFMLVLPKITNSTRVPLLIFQHGLNSSRAQVAAVANDFARAGYAVIGIDALWHGDRAVSPKDTVHNISGAAGADGLADLDEATGMVQLFAITGDPAVGMLPFDGRAIQDNFRQAVVDIAALIKLVTASDLSKLYSGDSDLSAISIDASRLVYSGESFGSILGTLSLATIPALKAGVLSVPTAGLFTPTFTNSPYFGTLLQSLLSTLFDRRVALNDPDRLPGNAQLALSLLQAALEPADPVAYAARLRDAKDKSVLLLQAYSDELLPNQATAMLAKQLDAHVVGAPGYTSPLRYTKLTEGKSPLSANAGANATRALINVNPATHGMFSGFSGERVFELGFPPAKKHATPKPIDNPIEWLHQVAIRFADSYRKDGVPTVDTSAP